MTRLCPALLTLTLLAAPTTGQSWLETIDAGDLPATAQAAQGYGPLTTITGQFAAANDIDMFLVEIASPTQFSATVTSLVDPVLYLFDEHGRGITACDDAIGLNPAISSFHVRTPGRYYLAIAHFAAQPVAHDGVIWLAQTTTGEYVPNGLRPTESVTRWDSNSSATGGYTILLTGTAYAGGVVVLPSDHHLSELPTLAGGTSGSTSFWRAGGGRFQVLYEGSHIRATGTTGAVNLRKLMFRGEDGELHLGGATWSNVTVRVASTSLTAATMSSNFATNLAAATTTVGATGTTTVVMAPSSGATPNNPNVVIDLHQIGAGITLDPFGAQPNVLIDITMPTAATPAGNLVMAIQDITPTTPPSGRAVSTTTAGATTGTFLNPPVVQFETAGPVIGAISIPARNETYGGACGGAAATFYQAFALGQGFDLLGLNLVPDNAGTPTRYTVEAQTTPVQFVFTNQVPNSTADDALVTHNLGFTFRYPGGSTTTIKASTNGFLWLGDQTTSEPTPTIANWLGSGGASNPARLAPLWHDFHCGRNTTIDTRAGLHVQTDTSFGPGNAVCYVTWRSVGLYNTVATPGTADFSMQCVLHEATGRVEFRYQRMPRFLGAALTLDGVAGLVGFTRGRIGNTPSVDPQSRDLSYEVPFTTQPEGISGHMGQTVTSTPFAGGTFYGGRAFAGQQLRWNVNDIPPGTLLGVQLLDLQSSRPGFTMPTITAPGCMLSTSANPVVWEVALSPGSTFTGTVPFAVPPGFHGTTLHAQFVSLGGLAGAPDLITVASNAVRSTVGRH